MRLIHILLEESLEGSRRRIVVTVFEVEHDGAVQISNLGGDGSTFMTVFRDGGGEDGFKNLRLISSNDQALEVILNAVFNIRFIGAELKDTVEKSKDQSLENTRRVLRMRRNVQLEVKCLFVQCGDKPVVDNADGDI